jgi:hypothetical protein
MQNPNPELAGRIAILENDRQNYTTALATLDRSEGYRIFRKILGITLEALCYIAALIAVVAIIILAGIRDELIAEAFRSHPFIAGTEFGETAKTELYELFYIMQAVVGVLAAGMIFVAYLAGKVRRRNNSIKNLKVILRNALLSTENQLIRAREIMGQS